MLQAKIIWIYPFFSAYWLLAGGSSQEYCNGETFQANCGKDDIIVMDKAHYGRMEVGKCVDENLGFLGCHMDALSKVDRLCSGETACDLMIVDRVFTDTNPCSKDLKLYLEAAYHCTRVLPTSSVCNSHGEILLKDPVNVISSKQIQGSTCLHSGGSTWNVKVKASPGQQVNVTLMDFGYDGTNGGHSCNNYGQVADAHTKQGTPICGGYRRIGQLFISNSNALDLTLDIRPNEANFALQFEVLGCPDLKPHGNSWVERDGASLSVGCHDSKQTWNLQCEGNRWIGTIGNCTTAAKVVSAEVTTEDSSGVLSTDVSISLITCLTILICLAVIVAGVNYWKRNTLKNYMLRMQQEVLKQVIQPQQQPSQQAQEPQESDYMILNFKPKPQPEEGEDAVYDFCFMPGTSSGAGTSTMSTKTLQNNLVSAKTLPIRGDAKVNNGTVRFMTQSPKIKTREEQNQVLVEIKE